MLKADFVIAARIVHQGVQASKSLENPFNGLQAVFGRREIDGDQAALATAILQFALQVLTRLAIAPDDNWNGAFPGAGSYDGLADPFGASRYDDHLVFELQVHRLASQVTIRGTVHTHNTLAPQMKSSANYRTEVSQRNAPFPGDEIVLTSQLCFVLAEIPENPSEPPHFNNFRTINESSTLYKMGNPWLAEQVVIHVTNLFLESALKVWAH